MENLIDVLGRESTEYEALLQLSQRKTPIIAGGDLAELQKITDEEQELVSRIHNLDRQRAGVTADIADVLNRDVKELKLPNLITMLSARPAEQQALAEAHDRLQAAVRGLKRVNEQNSELLNSALDDALFGGDGPGFGARFMAVVAAAEPERQQQKQDEAFFHRGRGFP